VTSLLSAARPGPGSQRSAPAPAHNIPPPTTGAAHQIETPPRAARLPAPTGRPGPCNCHRSSELANQFSCRPKTARWHRSQGGATEGSPAEIGNDRQAAHPADVLADPLPARHRRRPQPTPAPGNGDAKARAQPHGALMAGRNVASARIWAWPGAVCLSGRGYPSWSEFHPQGQAPTPRVLRLSTTRHRNRQPVLLSMVTTRPNAPCQRQDQVS